MIMTVEHAPSGSAPQSKSSRTSTPVRKNRLEDILNPVPNSADVSTVMTSGRASVEPFCVIDADELVAPHSTEGTRRGLFNYRTINAENIAIVNAKLGEFLLADSSPDTDVGAGGVETSFSRKRKSVEVNDVRGLKRRHESFPPASDCSSLTSLNEEDQMMTSDDEENDASLSPPSSKPTLPPSSSSAASTSRLKPSPSSEDETAAEDDEILSTTGGGNNNNNENSTRTIITCRFGSCNAIINTIHSPLGYHLNEHHKPSSQDRNGDVACQWDTCGVQVKWRNLRRHIMESHLGTLSKDCSGCGKMFSRSDALKRHQKHYCGGKKMPAQAGLGWEGAAKLKHATAAGIPAACPHPPLPSTLPPPLQQRPGSSVDPILEPIPPTGRSVGRGRGRTPPRKSRPYPSPTDPSSSYYRQPLSQGSNDQKPKPVHTLFSVDPHRHYPREVARAELTSRSTLSAPSLSLSDNNTPYRRYSGLHTEHLTAPKPVVFQWRSTVSWE